MHFWSKLGRFFAPSPQTLPPNWSFLSHHWPVQAVPGFPELTETLMREELRLDGDAVGGVVAILGLTASRGQLC